MVRVSTTSPHPHPALRATFSRGEKRSDSPRALRRRRWAVAVALSLAASVLVIRLWPHPPLSAHAPQSTAVYDAHGRLLRLTLSRDDTYRLWRPLAQMPPALVEAVRLHEDRWFGWHPGFNPVSLARGAARTYLLGGRRQGGSTLTMQLARLLYRLDTRRPWGKLRQVLRAVQLELCYSKSAILEAYLNLAPYGGNIEGVGAASFVYLGKDAQDLSLPEALALAVIPQDPTGRTRGIAAAGDRAGVLPPALRAARERLYQRWRRSHPADATADALLRLPLALHSPRQLPFAAPHAVEQVLAQARRSGAVDSSIDTTLDLALQATLERQIAAFVATGRERGLDNASALLVDVRDMAVKALVGSADYFDAAIAGQVNGSAAKRSPGSTLKPFVYALGIDQGVLHPRTVLRDVPTAFGPFTPENFDGRFLGPVTATDALNRSRNIPAVQVASKLASPTLYGFLKAAGIARMASERHYGLALVLGGGEVTMQELAGLYAMLAHRGVLRPLRWRAGEPQRPGVRLLSPEASFITLDMLRRHPRPDEGALAPAARLPVYWKTGTSWGFRDAWTAGVFGPYVLVVWVGNFDGGGNPALIGIEAAAPLFFRIVDALLAQNPRLAEPAWTLPANLAQVEVCLASGDLPNAWCPQRGRTWFIPGKSPIRVSTVHRPVVVDLRTGKPACPPYDPATTRTEIFEYWPSDLARVFAQAGIPRRPPPDAPDCDALPAAAGDAPRIGSPLRGLAYGLRRNHPEQSRIAFNATVDASARALYWFVDDAFAGVSAPGETLWWQAVGPGAYQVRAVDDQGRGDGRELRVVAVE